MPLRFELLEDDYFFNVYTVDGLEKTISSFNGLVYWVNNVIDHSKNFNARIDEDTYHPFQNKNDALMKWLNYNFCYGKKLIFVSSFSELENYYFNLEWEPPRALVVDNYGRIINIPKLYDFLIRISNDFSELNDNGNKKIYKFDTLGSFKVFKDNEYVCKKITSDIIKKNIENGEYHFKILSCNYFRLKKYKMIFEFRKDPVPGIHYRIWSKFNGANAGIKNELATYFDEENREFIRKNRKNKLIYSIDNFYERRHFYSNKSWKQSSKYNKQWEKKCVKPIKNGLHGIDGYDVVNRKLYDKDYYDQRFEMLLAERSNKFLKDDLFQDEYDEFAVENFHVKN